MLITNDLNQLIQKKLDYLRKHKSRARVEFRRKIKALSTPIVIRLHPSKLAKRDFERSLLEHVLKIEELTEKYDTLCLTNIP